MYPVAFTAGHFSCADACPSGEFFLTCTAATAAQRSLSNVCQGAADIALGNHISHQYRCLQRSDHHLFNLSPTVTHLCLVTGSC
jgi:hypothetical protein